MNRKEIIEKYFSNSISIDKNKHSGKPCLRGTRFPADQIIAEISGSPLLHDICEDFDLNQLLVEGFILDLCRFFDYIDKSDFPLDLGPQKSPSSIHKIKAEMKQHENH